MPPLERLVILRLEIQALEKLEEEDGLADGLRLEEVS